MSNTIEDYIRVGHTATGSYGNYVCTDLENFPTPSAITDELNDVDKDPFTDLEGFTHRNRVRTDVKGFTLEYSYLDADTKSYLLKRIKPEWFYVEVIDSETKQKSIHKMYASGKKDGVFRARKDENGNWYNDYVDFVVSFVEE